MDNSVTDNTAPDMTQAPVEQQAQAPSERTFRQSELNEIVGRAKHEAVESFKRQQAQNQQAYVQQPATSKTSSGLTEDDVKRLTGEELSRQRDEWERKSIEQRQIEEANRIVNAYKDKIASGRDKYQDFEAVTSNVDMRYYPNVVQLLAEHVDNASDILYDLSKNRSKLGNLEYMFERNPQDAIYEMKRLSESIKANEASSQMRSSNAPLSQQRPSNTGTDSRALSVRDYKKMYKG